MAKKNNTLLWVGAAAAAYYFLIYVPGQAALPPTSATLVPTPGTTPQPLPTGASAGGGPVNTVPGTSPTLAVSGGGGGGTPQGLSSAPTMVQPIVQPVAVAPPLPVNNNNALYMMEMNHDYPNGMPPSVMQPL